MSRKENSPCANCKSWNSQSKTFSCEPNQCKPLSKWLLKELPQLEDNKPQICVNNKPQIGYIV